MKYLKGIINTPPLCEVCGKPMQAEVFPADWNADGTGLIQCVGWRCPDCYDPLTSL